MPNLSRRNFLRNSSLVGLLASAGLPMPLAAQTIQTDSASADTNTAPQPRRAGRGTQPIDLRFPNPDGYITLRADLHLHSVFSDGDLWPIARVDEAKREGLDVLCISDHIEVRPNREEIYSRNLGRGYNLALPRATQEGILLIPGLEITRAEPHAKHLNALFLKDFNALVVEKFKDAVYAAAAQDAFIFWNHPAWGQAKQEAVWYPEMNEFLDKGILKGFEVVNGFEGDARDYQPDVMEWCQKYKVAMMGNSDAHKAIPYLFDWTAGGHRPMTLIFAKERTLDSVREALFAGRTAIYYYDYGKRDMLIGNEDWLKALFWKAVGYHVDSITNGMAEIVLRNEFAFSVELKRIEADGIELPEIICIPPGGTTLKVKAPTGPFNAAFEALNFDIAKGQKMIIRVGD